MKIKFGERLLVALCGLLVMLISIGIFVFGIGVFPFKLDLSTLDEPLQLWQRAVIVAVSLLLFTLGLHSICVLFRRSREKGFIIQHTELGDMSISMNALENMVKKCVDSHHELTVNSARIHRTREGILVDIKITLSSGVNIPLTVNALQKQIKQYITSCSGVDVQGVRVMVETNTARLLENHETPEMSVDEPAAPTGQEPVIETAKTNHESFVHRIFNHTEEPSSYAKPSADAQDANAAARSDAAEIEIAPDETREESSADASSEAAAATFDQNQMDSGKEEGFH